MHVRGADPRDGTAVDRLLERSYPALMADSYGETVLAAALPLMTRSNPRLLGSGTYYVAERAGRIVGCGGWTLEHPGTAEIVPGVAHLRHFATDPAFTRQGVGRAIFRRCAAAAVEARAERFQVYSSFNAEAFYRSLGLAPVGRVDIPLGPTVSFPAVLMEGPIVTAD